MAGVGTLSAPPPSNGNALSSTLQSLLDLSESLMHKTSTIGDTIGGPIPESPNVKQSDPSGLIGALQRINNQLQAASQNVARLEKLLS